MSKVSDVKKYVAELIGTFVLVFMGCGSAVLAGKDVIGYLGIALAFGFSVLAMVYAIGDISGCHINPAVSISMFVAGKMKLKDTVMYVITQCLGAVIGASLLYGVALGKPGYSIADGLGQNGYDVASPGGFSIVSGFVGSTSERAPKGFAGIPIGLSLVLIHIVGIPITGTSVNPARSLGPAVLVGGTAMNQLWLFWVAPIMGGLLATLVWRLLR
jgi:aquaporin Z